MVDRPGLPGPSSRSNPFMAPPGAALQRPQPPPPPRHVHATPHRLPLANAGSVAAAAHLRGVCHIEDAAGARAVDCQARHGRPVVVQPLELVVGQAHAALPAVQVAARDGRQRDGGSTGLQAGRLAPHAQRQCPLASLPAVQPGLAHGAAPASAASPGQSGPAPGVAARVLKPRLRLGGSPVADLQVVAAAEPAGPGAHVGVRARAVAAALDDGAGVVDRVHLRRGEGRAAHAGGRRASPVASGAQQRHSANSLPARPSCLPHRGGVCGIGRDAVPARCRGRGGRQEVAGLESSMHPVPTHDVPAAGRGRRWVYRSQAGAAWQRRWGEERPQRGRATRSRGVPCAHQALVVAPPMLSVVAAGPE